MSILYKVNGTVVTLQVNHWHLWQTSLHDDSPARWLIPQPESYILIASKSMMSPWPTKCILPKAEHGLFRITC